MTTSGITSILISYERAWTYYTKYHLTAIIHLYTLIRFYIGRYFHIHTYMKYHPSLIIHLYILIKPYIRYYLRAGPICHNIKTYPGYITVYRNMLGWGIISRIGWHIRGPPKANAPVCTNIYSKLTADTFPDTCHPEKRHEIEK